MGRIVSDISKNLSPEVAQVFEKKYLNRMFGIDNGG